MKTFTSVIVFSLHRCSIFEPINRIKCIFGEGSRIEQNRGFKNEGEDRGELIRAGTGIERTF